MEIDSPIYVHFAYKEERPKPEEQHISVIKSQLVVIEDDEEKDTSSSSSSSSSQGSSVSILNLPDLGRLSFPGSCFSVSGNSRLFFVGGSEYDKSERLKKFNEIRYIDLQQLSWKTSSVGPHPGNFCAYLSGTSFSKDGNSIYAFGPRNLYAFDSKTLELQFSVDSIVDSSWYPYLIAFSNTKIYLNCCISGKRYPREYTFGYYDIQSRTWNTLPFGPTTDYFLNERVIVFKDSYLIHFGSHNPSTGGFNPALYVYDILQGIWLPEPVQGIENDGHALPYPFLPHDEVYVGLPIPLPPSGFDQFTICEEASLIQVGSDDELKLKLALIWSTLALETDAEYFHCSKFTLTLDSGATSHFRAKHLFSTHFIAPDQLVHAKITA